MPYATPRIAECHKRSVEDGIRAASDAQEAQSTTLRKVVALECLGRAVAKATSTVGTWDPNLVCGCFSLGRLA